MRALLIAILVLALALAANAVAITKVSRERDALKKEEGTGLLFPSSIAKIIALEFKGLVADALFSRAQTFYGGKLMRKEDLSEEEWSWIYKSADIATDLDPYFLDPYYFGAVNLAWEANRVKEANALLEKALRYRTWDWTIPFYLGFNHFYFLQDNEKASEYLMEASRRPGSSSLMVDLAVKLSYKVKRTENAIIFLENILKRTDDEKLRREYETRILALKRLLYLENGVAFYRDKFGKKPKGLEELIQRKIINEIPADPYGGVFHLDAQGRVSSTSNFMTIYTHK
jgi:tetratricopeptide (TPR) repeat protein